PPERPKRREERRANRRRYAPAARGTFGPSLESLAAVAASDEAGALEVVTEGESISYKQPTATPLDHL
ncbi:hypothetical protein FK85_31410, partial [Halorubrum saccharovorum]